MWSILATQPTIVSHSGCVTVIMKPHRSHNHRQLFPARFSDDFPIPAAEHTNRSVSLRSTLRWKPRRKTLHASIFGPVLKFTSWRVRNCLATGLLQQCRLPPINLSNHFTCPVVTGKALIFHFFSPVAVSELFSRLNLLSFCVF